MIQANVKEHPVCWFNFSHENADNACMRFVFSLLLLFCGENVYIMTRCTSVTARTSCRERSSRRVLTRSPGTRQTYMEIYHMAVNGVPYLLYGANHGAIPSARVQDSYQHEK